MNRNAIFITVCTMILSVFLGSCIVEIIGSGGSGYKPPVGGITDSANCVEVDLSGDVYLAGDWEKLVGSASNYDMWVKKFDKNGVEYTSWKKRVDLGNGSGTDNNGQYVNAMVVDKKNNLYVGGYTDNGTYNTAWFIVKYNKEGVEQWRKIVDSTTDASQGGGDDLYDMAIDSGNNLYCVGTSSDKNHAYMMRKYDENGNEVWKQYHESGNSYHGARAINIDSSDNIYIIGFGTNAYHWYITRYNTAGVEQGGWDEDIAVGDNGSHAYGIKTDSSGNVYICGTSYNKVGGSSLLDITIYKFYPDGTLYGAWGTAGVHHYGGTYNDGVGKKMVMNTAGNKMFVVMRVGTDAMGHVTHQLAEIDMSTGDILGNFSDEELLSGGYICRGDADSIYSTSNDLESPPMTINWGAKKINSSGTLLYSLIGNGVW